MTRGFAINGMAEMFPLYTKVCMSHLLETLSARKLELIVFVH